MHAELEALIVHGGRKPRRAKLATLLFVELVVQWVNVTAFIIPNAYELARTCDFFSTIIRARASASACAVPALRSPGILPFPHISMNTFASEQY